MRVLANWGHRALAGGIIVLALVGAVPAIASTVNVDYSFYNSDLTGVKGASTDPYIYGSFRYDDSSSGLLTFADLSAFSANVWTTSNTEVSYNLAFVQQPQTYSYFGYDTAGTWTPSAVAYPGFPWSSILVATTPWTGLWVDALTNMADPAGNGSNDGYYCNYSPGSCVSPGDHYLNAFTAVATVVPLPAPFLLLASGLGALALLASRRRSKKQVIQLA